MILIWHSDAYAFTATVIQGYDGRMKPAAIEMHEGPEAFTRFREAVKQILSVPKSDVPNPFGKRTKKKQTKIKGK